jgi:acyl-CoA dehydrogenase
VGAVPLLKLFGIVAGGWQLLRSASLAGRRLAGGDAGRGAAGGGVGAGAGGSGGGVGAGAGGSGASEAFLRAKLATAGFYADHVLSQAAGISHSIVHGAAGALSETVF